MKLRIYSARHPYGAWSWGYEIFNPQWPAGRQVITGTAWFATWREAWVCGSTELRNKLKPHRATRGEAIKEGTL